MRVPSRERLRPAWPFWLLLLAWFCANSPQSATFAVLAWVGEARSFAHHERLSTELAELLAGYEKPLLLAKAEELPSRPVAPAIPAEATVKKIELAVEHSARPPLPARSQRELIATNAWCDGVNRARPPHEPPRVALVS